jgi:murein hydrolase activator
MGKYLVFCLLVGLLPIAVSAEEIGLEAVDPQAEGLQQQKEQILGLLAQVDERYGDVSASLKKLAAQIASSNQALDKIRDEIAAYQEQTDKLNGELAGQVKAAYAMGQQDKLKLMINQQDPALSSRMMVYYEYINRTRLGKLAKLQQAVNKLDQLDLQKKTETDALEQHLGKKKAEQQALDEARKQRDTLVARLNDEFSSAEEQLSLLKESESKLIGLIGKLEQEEDHEGGEAETAATDGNGSDNRPFPNLTGRFSTLKGKLPMPVSGKLTGMFDNPAAKDIWKGVVINTQEGTEIRAVAEGKITFADDLEGYGRLIILEHDKKFMTLYAFNQSFYKHKGDWVKAGEVIASVGQSGGRTQPGLYFEIRRNGKPVDPLQWCRNE